MTAATFLGLPLFFFAIGSDGVSITSDGSAAIGFFGRPPFFFAVDADATARVDDSGTEGGIGAASSEPGGS